MKQPTSHPPPNSLASIEKRLRRLESKLTQLMLHMGLNPYVKTYDGDDMPAAPPPKEKEEANGDH